NGKQYRSKDGGVMNWFPATGLINFQGKASAKQALQSLFGEALPVPEAKEQVRPAIVRYEKVFVVHGHDTAAREQLELVLHKLGLDPFVLANTGGGGMTIIEALEAEIGTHHGAARFGIVLMTPDDVGYAKKDGPDKAEPRARQ